VKEFDKEDVYDNEIFPLIVQIRNICLLHEMPFTAITAFAKREEDKVCRAYVCVQPAGNIDYGQALAREIIKEMSFGIFESEKPEPKH